jgi:hypothetical protein
MNATRPQVTPQEARCSGLPVPAKAEHRSWWAPKPHMQRHPGRSGRQPGRADLPMPTLTRTHSVTPPTTPSTTSLDNQLLTHVHIGTLDWIALAPVPGQGGTDGGTPGAPRRHSRTQARLRTGSEPNPSRTLTPPEQLRPPCSREAPTAAARTGRAKEAANHAPHRTDARSWWVVALATGATSPRPQGGREGSPGLPGCRPLTPLTRRGSSYRWRKEVGDTTEDAMRQPHVVAAVDRKRRDRGGSAREVPPQV